MKSVRYICLLMPMIALAVSSANALENVRQLPARDLPVPSTVSPDMQAALHVRAVKMNSESRRTTPSFRHIALSHHRLISGSISLAKFRSDSCQPR
jgi:hypothetical protein